MSAAAELCSLGFDKLWVTQALELTNHDKDCALEWLLSDEFQLAQQQYNDEQKQSQKPRHSSNKKSKHRNRKKHKTQEIEIEVEYEYKQKMKPKKPKEIEIEIEYDLGTPNSDTNADTFHANIVSNKSIELSPRLLAIPRLNSGNNNNNKTAPFIKLSTTVIHSNESIDYSVVSDDSANNHGMEFLDEHMSMDMSSVASTSMSFNPQQIYEASMHNGSMDNIDFEFIDNAPKLPYSELAHLKHSYVLPLYYAHKKSLITATKPFNNKNENKNGIYCYDLLTNEWDLLREYPELFNVNGHMQCLDSEKHLLYIYTNTFEQQIIAYDIVANKFDIHRFNPNMKRHNIGPRLYQSIAAVHIRSVNQIHFIANTNLNSNHFVHTPHSGKVERIEMVGLEKHYVMNPKIIYCESLQRLYSFGGYNGSLHRDASFLQFNNIMYCDIFAGQKSFEYKWVNSANALPFKSSMFDVTLVFDTILLFFYGKVIYLFDLNLFNDDRQWYKCESVYPLNECYDLMISADKGRNNVHFIHCTNALQNRGLALQPAHYRHPSQANDKPYHIKCSVTDIIPADLWNKYKVKFPRCLNGIIRNLLSEYRLNTKFNDIPKDLFNIILGYFHPLCLAKQNRKQIVL